MSLPREGPAPVPPPETEGRRPRVFGLRTLLLLVGVFAAVLWCARVVRDAAVPAYQWMRLLHEGDAEQRREAASNLGDDRGALGGSLRPQIAGALISSLGDPDEEVAAAVMLSLSFLIQDEPDVDLARAWTAALSEGLRDPRPDVRKWAAFRLNFPASPRSGRSSPTASDALAAAMGDPVEDVRLAAASALGPTGTGDAGLRALVKALENDPAAGVRLTAARSLGIYSDRWDEATLALLRGLKSDDPAVGSACDASLQTLAQMNRFLLHKPRRTAAIVPALIAAATDPDGAVRLHVAFVLGEIGPDAAAAVPALIAMLGVPDDADKPSPPGRMIDNRAWSQAARAAEALGLVAAGTPREAEAGEAMLAVLARPPADLPARMTLALGVSRFSRPLARRAVPGLAEALKASTHRFLFELRDELPAACEALARLAPGTPDEAVAVDALTAALSVRWFDVPEAAARALAEFGPGAKSALPRLRDMVRGPTESSSTAQKAAREAIRIIESDDAHRLEDGP